MRQTSRNYHAVNSDHRFSDNSTYDKATDNSSAFMAADISSNDYFELYSIDLSAPSVSTRISRPAGSNNFDILTATPPVLSQSGDRSFYIADLNANGLNECFFSESSVPDTSTALGPMSAVTTVTMIRAF